jgi:hypothetical protein
VPDRAGRLFAGWSANLVQMVLGITQQVVLISVLLHHWTGDTLAAVCDLCHRKPRLRRRCRPAIPRNQTVSSAQIGRPLRRPHRAVLRRDAADLPRADRSVDPAGGAAFLMPSKRFGFVAVLHFDAAFIVVAAELLWTVPSNLVAALYRARGSMASR